jgi:hypothetical protein
MVGQPAAIKMGKTEWREKEEYAGVEWKWIFGRRRRRRKGRRRRSRRRCIGS